LRSLGQHLIYPGSNKLLSRLSKVESAPKRYEEVGENINDGISPQYPTQTLLEITDLLDGQLGLKFEV
jgi:hypothetical protein